MDPMSATIREQIEEKYLSGDFQGASDLCYQQLREISEPLESSSNPSFEHYKPLLKHQCFDSCCSCEHFLSLAAQFMFELHYPPEYIHSFLTNFYYREPHLPLVCVGLLAGMFIHQQKYTEAQQMLENSIAHAKEFPFDHWTQQEIEKYNNVLSILVLHVLLPQGYTDLATTYLSDHYHPTAVLPLDPSLKEDLTVAIETRKQEFERQFIEESQSAATMKRSGSQSIKKLSDVTKPTPSGEIQTKKSNTRQISTENQRPEGIVALFQWQFKKFGRLVVPMGVFTFLVTMIIFIIRKKKNMNSKDNWWLGKLVAGWELFENAIFPNYGLRRLQRGQAQ